VVPIWHASFPMIQAKGLAAWPDSSTAHALPTAGQWASWRSNSKAHW